MEKKCNNCEIIKNCSNFGKVKNRKNGFNSICKSCVQLTQKIYYISNKEKLSKSKKEEYKIKKHTINKRNKKYYENNKEKTNNKNSKWRKNNPEYQKEYIKINKEELKIKRNIKQKKCRKNNPIFKLKSNIKNLIGNSIRKKGFKKLSKTELILGCSYEEFKTHLESLWKPWMNWDNYGKGSNEWALDHTEPLSSAQIEEDIYRLSHFTNMKPMWSAYNMVKSDKTPSEWAAYKLQHSIIESIPPWATPQEIL